MRYLKYFESEDSKLELLKDVFSDLDLDFDIYFKVKEWTSFSLKTKSDLKFYGVVLNFDSYPKIGFGEALKNKIKLAEKYCDLEFYSMKISCVHSGTSFLGIDQIEFYSKNGNEYWDLSSIQGTLIKFIDRTWISEKHSNHLE